MALLAIRILTLKMPKINYPSPSGKKIKYLTFNIARIGEKSIFFFKCQLASLATFRFSNIFFRLAFLELILKLFFLTSSLTVINVYTRYCTSLFKFSYTNNVSLYVSKQAPYTYFVIQTHKHMYQSVLPKTCKMAPFL